MMIRYDMVLYDMIRVERWERDRKKRREEEKKNMIEAKYV